MKIELLPVTRWDELKQALKEARCEDELPKPQHSVMLGALQGGRLVACIGAEKVWNVSPLWIERDLRGNGLALELVKHLEVYNTENLREYCSTSSPHVERLIHSIGFVPTLGQCWRRNRG